MKFKAGDRVIDHFLGAGLIVELYHGWRAYSVMFDKTPPIDYNTGENPVMVFEYDLKLEDESA